MPNDTKASHILKDLENLYALAMEKGNFTVALKAKELLGREQGLFSGNSRKKKISPESLSDEELEALIQELEGQEEGGEK